MRTQRFSRLAVTASYKIVDPVTAEPNSLRDSVYKALMMLAEDERSLMRDRILAALGESGVNIGQRLLVLGIPARTPDELTAAEIAILIRYVRINDSAAISALAPILDGLINVRARVGRSARASARYA